MRNSFYLLALIASFTAFLTGCGKDSSNSEPLICQATKVNAEVDSKQIFTLNVNYSGNNITRFTDGTTTLTINYAGDSMYMEYPDTVSGKAYLTREVLKTAGSKLVKHIMYSTPVTGTTVIQKRNVGTFTYDANNLLKAAYYKNYDVTFNASRQQTAITNTNDNEFLLTYDASNNLSILSKNLKPAGGTSGFEIYKTTFKAGTVVAPNTATIPMLPLTSRFFDSRLIALFTKHNFFKTLPSQVVFFDRTSGNTVASSQNYTYVTNTQGNITQLGLTDVTTKAQPTVNYTFTYVCP